MAVVEVVALETNLHNGDHLVAAEMAFPLRTVVNCFVSTIDSLTPAHMISEKLAMLSPRVHNSHPTHLFLEPFDFFFRRRSTREIVSCLTCDWRR